MLAGAGGEFRELVWPNSSGTAGLKAWPLSPGNIATDAISRDAWTSAYRRRRVVAARPYPWGTQCWPGPAVTRAAEGGRWHKAGTTWEKLLLWGIADNSCSHRGTLPCILLRCQRHLSPVWGLTYVSQNVAYTTVPVLRQDLVAVRWAAFLALNETDRLLRGCMSRQGSVSVRCKSRCSCTDQYKKPWGHKSCAGSSAAVNCH